MTNIFCPSCGSACPQDSNFCLKCGSPLPRDYSSLPLKKESDFITLACPNCGGNLKITQDMERFACQYCGYEHLVRRNGNSVSLQPVMEGLRRVETKFDHVLSGSDRLAAEQTIQRLKVEIDDLGKRIDLAEKKKQKTSGQFATSLVVILTAFMTGGFSIYKMIYWDVSSDMFLLIVMFFISAIVVFGGFVGLAVAAKNVANNQKSQGDLAAMKTGLETRKQQLEKLHRYTSER